MSNKNQETVRFYDAKGNPITDPRQIPPSIQFRIMPTNSVLRAGQQFCRRKNDLEKLHLILTRLHENNPDSDLAILIQHQPNPYQVDFGQLVNSFLNPDGTYSFQYQVLLTTESNCNLSHWHRDLSGLDPKTVINWGFWR